MITLALIHKVLTAVCSPENIGYRKLIKNVAKVNYDKFRFCVDTGLVELGRKVQGNRGGRRRYIYVLTEKGLRMKEVLDQLVENELQMSIIIETLQEILPFPDVGGFPYWSTKAVFRQSGSGSRKIHKSSYVI